MYHSFLTDFVNKEKKKPFCLLANISYQKADVFKSLLCSQRAICVSKKHGGKTEQTNQNQNKNPTNKTTTAKKIQTKTKKVQAEGFFPSSLFYFSSLKAHSICFTICLYNTVLHRDVQAKVQ